MRKFLSLVIVCVLIITIFSGCGVLQKLGFQKNNTDELHPVSSVVMGEDEAKKLTDKVPIHLFFGNEDNTKLKLEIKYIPLTEAKKNINSLAGTVVKELINGPANKALKATIPQGTKLLSVTVKDRIATVDLSKEFVDKHPGGRVLEQLTLYSIVNSLTELKEIEKVKFTINGKTQKDYKGNFQFDTVFPRNVALITKTVTSPSIDTPDTTKAENDIVKSDNTKTKDSNKDPNNVKSTNDSSDKQTNSDVSGDSEETYIETLE
jgi:germination protein M